MHIELMSNDPPRTKRFFGDVFGWKFQDMPEFNYTTYEAPNPPHGGLMAPPENMTAGTLNYLWAKEIDLTLRRIQAAGGAVLQPKKEIPNVGYWALFREPGGTIHALYQDMPRPQPARKPAAKKAKARAKGKRRK